MYLPQNEYGGRYDPAYGQSPAGSPELVCRCPSCAASLNVATENAENIKVQCMVCGTIFSPLGNAATEPASHYRAPMGYDNGGYDYPSADGYASPPPYSPQLDRGYTDPYSEFYSNTYRGQSQQAPYPDAPYAYHSPGPDPYAQQPAPYQPNPYMESGYSPYQPPADTGGYTDNPYYNAPSGYREGDYQNRPPYGARNYPAASPYPDTQPYGYSPYINQPGSFEPSSAPAPSAPAPPMTQTAQFAPPEPLIPLVPQTITPPVVTPPAIQQLPVRGPSVPPPEAHPPVPPPSPAPKNFSPFIPEENTPVPPGPTDEQKKISSATKQGPTGTSAPAKEIPGDGNPAHAFKLVKSEYDYYMKDEKPPIKKKGSFFKIFFFMFLPLVAIGWSIWSIYSQQNLILYVAVAVICFVVFIFALVSYNRNCPHCGRWSALIKEKKQDQYGKSYQLQCKHCDFTLEAER